MSIRINNEIISINKQIPSSLSLHPEREVLLDDDIAQIIKDYQATHKEDICNISLAWCTNITDRALESLPHLSSLQKLNLAYCSKITSAGIESLAYLGLLDRLDVTGTNVTLDQLEQLDDTQENISQLRKNFSSFSQIDSFLHSGKDANPNSVYNNLYNLVSEYI